MGWIPELKSEIQLERLPLRMYLPSSSPTALSVDLDEIVAAEIRKQFARNLQDPGAYCPIMTPPTLFFTDPLLHGRRDFFKRLSAGALLFAVPGAFAEELLRTPRQTEGPFYPDKLPLDTD